MCVGVCAVDGVLWFSALAVVVSNALAAVACAFSVNGETRPPARLLMCRRAILSLQFQAITLLEVNDNTVVDVRHLFYPPFDVCDSFKICNKVGGRKLKISVNLHWVRALASDTTQRNPFTGFTQKLSCGYTSAL
jgi:hypothetical protein